LEGEIWGEGRLPHSRVDFAPSFSNSHVPRIGPGVMPQPRPASLDTLFTGREDSYWVQAEGNVSAIQEESGHIRLTMVEGLHTFSAYVVNPGLVAGHLLDARVRVEGACGAVFNERRQLIGIRLFVPGSRYVTILRPGAVNAADIPDAPISSLMQYSPEE